MVLDRDFTDSVNIPANFAVQRRGLIVRMPTFIGQKSKLTSEQVNCTKTRCIIKVLKSYYIANAMIAKANGSNKSFNASNNLTLFPKLSDEALKDISQGTYQNN